MASGFSSCHPDQVDRLKRLGISSAAVVQGFGHAPLSAGTHGEVGKISGKPFGHCIDLSPNEVPFSRSTFDKLVQEGFAPFARIGWSGGDHWHIVDASRPAADGGKQPDHLEGVNHQLHEWVNYGDGLVGNDPMPMAWRPTPAQTALIKQLWTSGSAPRAGEPDAPEDWARESWDWAKANGIITTTRPQDGVTVQWVIAVLHRLWGMALKAFAPKQA